MPRHMPKSLPLANRRPSPTPEERLLAHQEFRYRIGILRAWEDFRQASACAADPRRWIPRHPLGSVAAAGVLAAIYMRRKKQPPPPRGIRATVKRVGWGLLRRAVIAAYMTRMVRRIWDDIRPASLEEGEPRFQRACGGIGRNDPRPSGIETPDA